MSPDRVASLLSLLEKNPGDHRLRLGLAMEYEKLGRWQDVARELELYLLHTDDQGNAWGRLGNALLQLGRDQQARDAYQRGIEAARRHGHPTMASEFEETLGELD
jgi:tetratricopeptide (TPR) repeat protein